jgi:hypothetical protein
VKSGFCDNYPSSCAKLTVFSADCGIIKQPWAQEAYSQQGTGGPLPDQWCEAGREVRTQHENSPVHCRIVIDA